MHILRAADNRGYFDHGWLKTYHSFSFAEYFDPAHMGFRVLRVINEDRVQPGQGFGTHPHRDMEILTYVIEGALEHRDSMGNGSVITPGEVQRMTAGTGVTHSEANPSNQAQVHFLQIWVLPEKEDLTPSYEQKRFSDGEKHNALKLVVSRDGRDGSVTWHQDAFVYATLLDRGAWVDHPFGKGRHGWLQLVRGRVTANGQPVAAGDGLAMSGEASIKVEAAEDSEFVLFDLP